MLRLRRVRWRIIITNDLRHSDMYFDIDAMLIFTNVAR
jgi:hypothetical protein